MAKYKLTLNGTVSNTETGGNFDPTKQSNLSSKYEAWLAEGNTPDPADPIPELTYEEKREREYPPIKKLIVALWEKVVEGRTNADSGITDLQTERENIKAKYPKPA